MRYIVDVDAPGGYGQAEAYLASIPHVTVVSPETYAPPASTPPVWHPPARTISDGIDRVTGRPATVYTPPEDVVYPQPEPITDDDVIVLGSD